MKKKERKHKIKQANTLETSKKTLQKATMTALHNGGFLFVKGKDGYFAPAIVNARITDLVSALVSFTVSQANTPEALHELHDYVEATLNRACKLREEDITAPPSVSENTGIAIAALIAEAEGKGSPGTEDTGKCSDV